MSMLAHIYDCASFCQFKDANFMCGTDLLHILDDCTHLLYGILQVGLSNVLGQLLQLLQQHAVLLVTLCVISSSTDQLRQLQRVRKQ